MQPLDLLVRLFSHSKTLAELQVLSKCCKDCKSPADRMLLNCLTALSTGALTFENGPGCQEGAQVGVRLCV